MPETLERRGPDDRADLRYVQVSKETYKKTYEGAKETH
jgi:hypothetical protein